MFGQVFTRWNVRGAPKPLLGPPQWGANETESRVQIFGGLSMKDDEERVVEPRLEFKRVNLRRQRKKEGKRHD
ncbi:hypothetical protein TNCV_4507351 [Trichonephila clavipes]|nr:hypothetical protein TNCV_4507351 [Trichonephila clavipes]